MKIKYEDLLAMRNVFLLSIYAFIMTLVGGALAIIIYYHFYEVTESPLSLGLLYFFPIVFRIFLFLVAGMVVSIMGSINVLILIYFIGLAFDIAIYFLIPFSRETIYLLYIIFTLSALTGPFYAIAVRVLIPDLVSRDMLLRANSIFNIASRSPEIFSPFLGGLLGSLYGYKNAVLILIVFNLISLFPLLLLARLVSTQPRGMDSESRSYLADLSAGISYLRSSRDLLLLLAISSIFSFFMMQFLSVYLLVAVRDLLGVGVDIFGLLVTISNIGGVAGAVSLTIYRRSGVGSTPTFILIIASGLSILPMAFIYDLYVYIALLLIQDYTATQASILITTIYQERVEKKYLTAFLSLTSFINNLLSALGALSGGYISTQLGITPSLIITSISISLSALLLLIWNILSPHRTSTGKAN
jgi:DHA3 family macrolide efflux protein-like MFS transporter